jgi:hypothetical protein
VRCSPYLLFEGTYLFLSSRLLNTLTREIVVGTFFAQLTMFPHLDVFETQYLLSNEARNWSFNSHLDS